jgi:hypothetical protein
LTIPAGQHKEASVRVAPYHRQWFGPQETYPFIIQVVGPEEETQEHHGQYVSQPMSCGWWALLAFLLFLCVALSGAILIIRPPLPPPLEALRRGVMPTPTPTPQPSFEVTVSKQTIVEGACVELRWIGDGVQDVFLEGVATPITQTYEVCPETTTTYTLRTVSSTDDPKPLVVTQTITVVSLETRAISFMTFPNGKPITPVCVLEGDEFEELGVSFTIEEEALPEQCQAKSFSVAIAGSKGKGSVNFLTTLAAEDANSCMSAPLSITFLEATQVVTFTFLGVIPDTYQIFADDATQFEDGDVEVSKGDSTISFRTILNENIGRVVFIPDETGTIAIPHFEYRFIPKQ